MEIVHATANDNQFYIEMIFKRLDVFLFSFLPFTELIVSKGNYSRRRGICTKTINF
jgi:hypothetical protein